MANEPWLMKVENGLSAHFKQENGPSLPGVLWAVKLKQGNSLYTAMVKILFAGNAPAEIRSNQEEQAQAAMHYLNEQLATGWHPDQEIEHTIIFGSPQSLASPAEVKQSKPWWRFW